MIKYKTLENAKQFDAFRREVKNNGGEIISWRTYKVRSSYAGKNHTFYEVKYTERVETI